MRDSPSAVAWKQLDLPTRVGFVASVVAAVGILIPPLSLLSAVVAIVCSGIGWQRAHRRQESNPVAKFCFVGCVALVVLVVVGSAIYSAAN